MARKSRSKQRSKGAGTRSSKAKSSGKSQGGSRSGGKSKSKSSSSKGKSSSSKSKSSSNKGRSGAGTGGGQKSNPTKKAPAPKKVTVKAPAPKPAPKAKAPAPKPKPKPTPAPVAKKKEPTKAQQLAKDRIGSGTAKKPDKTISQVKADNKASMQQKAAERNTKFKQTGVQTLGGKKTTFTKAEEKKITDAGYSVAGYSKAPAQSNTQLQINKDIERYGNTVPEGSFGISEEGKALAAQQKAEAAAKKAEADKKAAAEAAAKKAAEEKARKAEEKRQVQFDPARLRQTFDVANILSPGGDMASWYNQGADPSKSFKQVLGDEISMSQRTKGVGKGAWNPARGMPGYGSIRNVLTGKPFNTKFEGGFETGPTEANRRVFNNLSKAYIGAQLFKQGQTGSLTDRTVSNTPNLNLGGLSIGFKSPESTDIGARTGRFLSSAFDKVAGGLNIGGSAQASEGGVDSAPSKTGRTLTNRALGAVDAVVGTDLDGRGGRTTPFGERLTQSVGAFGTLNQNISDLSGQPTGPINTAKNLAKSLAVGGKNLSMEDMAASTSFAKAFKDKPLDAVANLNPDGSKRVIKTLSTLNKNKDVSEALANYGGEGFQKGLRDTASLVSDNYDKLSTDAKGNRKVVSDMLMGNDPRAEFGKRLAFQQKENPQLSMQSKIKYASDPNFKQYTGTDRQGNKVFENKIKGINRKEMGIVGSLGNFVLSNQGRDVVTGNLPGTNNALDLASNIINTGRDPKSSTYKASQGFLKTIGAGGQPTPGSIIRGVNPFRGSNRGRGTTTTTTPTFQSVGTGGGGGTPVGQVAQIPATGTVPQFQVPELPVQQGTDPSNLANIQNESYQSTFKNLMAINPNYSARFQMRRRRGGRRGSFKRAFSRRFFS